MKERANDRKKTDGKVSRRDFLKVSGIAAAGVTLTGLAGCSSNDKPGDTVATATWQPAEWADTADIVIVGYGGAGIAAAICAIQEGYGDTLVLEVAPKGQEGGNTLIAGELVFCPTSAKAALDYQTELNSVYTVEPELMEAWADELAKNIDWLNGLGADMQPVTTRSPEFHGLPGSDEVRTYQEQGIQGKSLLWDVLKTYEEELGWRVAYDSRVVELVKNPDTGEIVGVKLESGEYIKALKGVILSCGGYENNPEMMNTYYNSGFPHITLAGTPWNRGDGIKMAQEVGAQLWHMNTYSLGPLGVQIEGKESLQAGLITWPAKDYIFVSPNSKRYACEERAERATHGKTKENGMWVGKTLPYPLYAIFTSLSFDNKETPLFKEWTTTWLHLVDKFKAFSTEELLASGVIQKGDTAEELAEKIGLDPATLAATIQKYNEDASSGIDTEFGRGQTIFEDGFYGTEMSEKVAAQPFELIPLQAPYYAMEITQTILNTQGGPKRGAKCEVLDAFDQPIPRLFSAGELGAIYSFLYNGGGNVAEAFSTGRIAARSAGALDSWEA